MICAATATHCQHSMASPRSCACGTLGRSSHASRRHLEIRHLLRVLNKNVQHVTATRQHSPRQCSGALCGGCGGLQANCRRRSAGADPWLPGGGEVVTGPPWN